MMSIFYNTGREQATALGFSETIVRFIDTKEYWFWTSPEFDAVCVRLKRASEAERRGAFDGTSFTAKRRIGNTNYYMVVRDSSTRPIVSVLITPEACVRLKDAVEYNWPRGASGNTIKTSLLGAYFLDSEPPLRQLLDVIAHQHLMLFTKDF